VLPAVAALTTWAHAEATDTSRFADHAQELADDHAVQQAVTDELVAVADQRLAGVAVPGGPDALHARVRAIADQVVAAPAYRQALRTDLRSVHARLQARLTGDVHSPLLFDLVPVAAPLRDVLRAEGLPEVADAIGQPGEVVVATRAEVRHAHHGYEAVRAGRAIAIPGAVLALLGVIVTARRRRTGLLRAALCLVAAIGLGWIAAGIIRDALDDDVAVAVFDVLRRPLRWWAAGGAVLAAALTTGWAALAARGYRAQRAARHPWPLPRP
jgi:hypothetical protein